MVRLPHCLTALLLLLPLAAHPQARFDLTGPSIDIRVTRAGVELPIALVPNLQSGDQLWLHPNLPPTQSVHYLLVAAFLRGTTNPPPDQWFTRVETWNKKVREEGVTVTVPPEAQQAILFLAPETGGDFSTLRSAVQGRPGIFVRATQDLTEAGFEQARVDAYLEAMKRVPPDDAAALLAHSNLLARTLNLKPNPDCFKRPLDQQYTCLTQSGTQTLLDDGHGVSLLAALSNGAGSDFINQASYTRLAGAGNYSAYVGAIVDFTRILASLHTAQYQYIPALATPKDQSLNLRLNTAPSFHNPKSVIVIGLPAIQAAVPPPLRPAEPNHISCLLDPAATLPVDGAPLVFSTAFAHALTLHIATQPPQDLPLTPDAFQGGLILAPTASTRHELPFNPADPATTSSASTKSAPSLDVGTHNLQPTPTPTPPPSPSTTAKQNPHPESLGAPGSTVSAPTLESQKPNQTSGAPTPGIPTTGTIHGFWGFDPFTGPTVAIQQTPGQGWRIVDPAATTLIAGQPNHLQLLSTGTACIRSIALEPSPTETKLTYKLAETKSTKPEDLGAPGSTASPSTLGSQETPIPTKPQPVDLTLNLQKAATPGDIHLAILQFGQQTPDQLASQTFAAPAKLDALLVHAGDLTATLTGASLDQVATLTASAATYIPQTPEPSTRSILLTLQPAEKAPTFKPNEKLTAQVLLHDGRKLEITTTVLPPRPVLTLLSRRAVLPTPSPIQLATPNDVPLGAQLHFFLKSRDPFPRTETIEIASADPDPATPAPSAESADPAPALRTVLSIAAGTLVLQDAHTILATFDPLKAFGPSTYGPFRFRAIAPPERPQPKAETRPEPSHPGSAALAPESTGTPGEWVSLATIVRLPTLTALTCPPTSASARAAAHASAAATPQAPAPAPAPASSLASGSAPVPSPVENPITTPAATTQPSLPPAQTCTLTGDNLYLIDSLAPTLAFLNPTQVPEGFVDPTLPLARPQTPGTFYLKLRDDPTTTQTVTLPLR